MSLAQAAPLALCSCLFALGCQELAQESPQQPSQDAVEDTTPAPQPAIPPQKGDLLIEELYYSGARPKGGTDHYFSDQFIELVNTTDHPLDLSGVMIGDVYGSSGAINPGMKPNGYATSHPEQVVLRSVWRVPAGARLETGARLIIAHDGTNHRPFSTVDLSAAGFETFVAAKGKDDDYLTVDNLESVVFNGGYDWLITVFGPSVVVLQAGVALDSFATPMGQMVSASAAGVLDGVEALMDEASAAFKRLPASVDAGFAFVAGTYVGESLHRVQVDGVWQDTDDSSADFIAGKPNPHRVANPQGVYGEPTVELGGGVNEFIALSEDDPVELVAGIQGGWHVDASVRLGGFGPDDVLLVYDAVNQAGERVSFETQALLQRKSVVKDGEHWLRLADRIVFDIPKPDAVVGSTLILRVTAKLGGQSWSDERRVVIQDEVE